MSTSEQSKKPNGFFCALLPCFGEFGDRADVDYSVHPYKVRRCHCAMDVYPMSNIFEVFPCILVAKSLAAALVKAECSGFRLREAELELSDKFLEFSELHERNKKLPPFQWCEISGEPGIDDFGLERKICLIVSNRVKEIIETGPAEGINFIPGSNAPSDKEITDILFEEAKSVAKQIYESRNRPQQ